MPTIQIFAIFLIAYSFTAMALTAQADTQEWSGEKSFTAKTTITDDISITGDVSINVSEGVTVTLSGEVSGSATIVKKGLGFLLFGKTNSNLSSPIIVSNGVLSAVNTVNNAWGSGKITLCCTGDKSCQLQLVADSANEIELTGSSNANYPAFVLAAASTLSGKITSAGNIYIVTQAYAGKTISEGNNTKLAFNGEIYAPDCTITCAAFPRVAFNGKVTSGKLYGAYKLHDSSPTGYNCGSILLANPANQIGTLSIDQTRFVCSNTNVFRNAVLEWTGDHHIAGYGTLNLNGNNQVVSDFSMPECDASDETSYIVTNSASSIAWFTISKAENGIVNCYAKFDGPITLSTDAPNNNPVTIFLKNRRHLMSGELQANKSLVVDGGTSMEKVTRLYACNSSLLACSSTVANVFASVKTIEIASCTLDLSAAAVSSFPVDKIAFNVNSAASVIKLPTDSILRVYTLTDNALMSLNCGVYNSSNYAKIYSGTIWVQYPYTANPVKWVGGGTSTAFSDDANWEGGTAPDMVNFVSTCPNFAMSGYGSAAVDNLYKLNGIVFDTPGGFTLTKSGASSGIELYGNILTTNSAADSLKRPYAIEPTLTLKQDVVVTVGAEDGGVGARDSLSLLGGISGSGKLTKKGFGNLFINGAEDFTGPIVHSTSNSTLILSGIIGAENTANSLTVDANAQCCCWFSNAVLRMKTAFVHPTVSPPTSPGYAVKSTWLLAMAGTTNIIYDKIGDTGCTAWWSAQSKAKLTVCGGHSNSSKLEITGGGEVEILDKPLNCYTRSKGESYVDANSGATLSLNCTGCNFRRLYVAYSGTIKFVRSGALLEKRSAMKDSYAGYNYLDIASGVGAFDFTTSTQHCGYVSGTAVNNAVLTGQYGSRLIIRQTPVNKAVSSIYAPVNGALSIVAWMTNGVAGVCTNTLKIVGAKNSSGDLIASAGTLELASGASWLNGTNFIAEDKGKIKLNAANQINPQIAALHFSGNGVIEIPANVIQKVRSAEVGGVEVPRGTYVASELESSHPLYGRIGSGTLKVAVGTMLIVK